MQAVRVESESQGDAAGSASLELERESFPHRGASSRHHRAWSQFSTLPYHLRALLAVLYVFAEDTDGPSVVRLSKATLAARSRGQATNGIAPFGWQIGPGGELLELPAEMKIVRYVREQRAKGQKLDRIVELCRARGFCSRKGKPIGRTQVARLLSRPVPKKTPSPSPSSDAAA